MEHGISFIQRGEGSMRLGNFIMQAINISKIENAGCRTCFDFRLSVSLHLTLKIKEKLKHKKAVGSLEEALYSPIPTATELIQ